MMTESAAFAAQSPPSARAEGLERCCYGISCGIAFGVADCQLMLLLVSVDVFWSMAAIVWEQQEFVLKFATAFGTSRNALCSAAQRSSVKGP